MENPFLHAPPTQVSCQLPLTPLLQSAIAVERATAPGGHQEGSQMALIKYGPLASEVSGSVGGVTFARVHDAKACRSWRAPVNKRSLLQLEMRRELSRASFRWFDYITQASRDAWDTYAATCAFTNPLGDAYTISGFNMFTRNAFFEQLFAAEGVEVQDISDPPAGTGFPSSPVVVFDFTHATGVVRAVSVTPDIDPYEGIFFTILKFIRVSRKYPKAIRVGRKAMDDEDTEPFTIHTYDPKPPGIAGEYRAIVKWSFYDDDRRVSKPATVLVTST